MRLGPRGVSERLPDLSAGADAELGVHLAQVPLDRARADEQLGADFRVGLPLTGEPGDLRLLGGELLARLGSVVADGFPGSQQLTASALRERLEAYRGAHLVGRTQLLARVDATPAAA